MKIVYLLLLGAVLTACATPYQNNGLRGGYTERKIKEHVFEISFGGNGMTTRRRATDFALLRCAELTLEQGGHYFVIIDSERLLKIEKNSVDTGSGTPSTYHVQQPRATNTIVIFENKPDIESYDARDVQQSLNKKYGLD